MKTIPPPFVPSSRYSDQEYLTLQSRLLVTGRHEEIARQVNCHVSNIRKYANGDRHVPAFRAFALSAAQNNWGFLQKLADLNGMALMARIEGLPLPLTQAIGALIANFGRMMMLAEKLLQPEAEVWTEEELRVFEESLEKIYQVGHGILAQQRQKRLATTTVAGGNTNVDEYNR